MKVNKFVKIMLVTLVVTSSSIMSFAGNALANSEGSEQVLVVDMKTGNEEIYDLPQESNISESIVSEAQMPSQSLNMLEGIISGIQSPEIDPLTIFGSDDRKMVSDTSEFPYCAIALITVTYKNGEVACGTGAMINDHLLATAGHMLVDEDGSHLKKVKIEFGRKGNYRFYQTSDISTYIVKGSFKGFNGLIEDDYGFIVFDKNIGSTTGHFGYASAPSLTETLYTAGYPADKKENYMYSVAGKMLSLTKDVVTFDNDIYPGQSGSPLYLMRGGLAYMMGVVSAEDPDCNWGRRLDTELYQWLLDNGYWR